MRNIEVARSNLTPQKLTEVTSSGSINMIRNEKYQASKTDNVTMM